MGHLTRIYKAEHWKVSYSGFTATKTYLPYIIAVVALHRDSTNRIPWIVNDLVNKRSRKGRAPTVEKAKALSAAWGYALSVKFADNATL